MLPLKALTESDAGGPDAEQRTAASATMRIKSEDLFRQGREVEIEHAGRIYRMRLTNSNKLILTA